MADDHSIRAPVPGTFYRRPDPDSPPFVEEGDAVGPDTVVGLVEVMKQFLEVKAESAGTIVAFDVENEGMVAPGDVIARLSGD